MVNGIHKYRETDGMIRWLVKDKRGLISLPIWIDRHTSQGTFQRFSLGEFSDYVLWKYPEQQGDKQWYRYRWLRE